MIDTSLFELTNWARKALWKSSQVWIDPGFNWVYQVNVEPLRDWTNCLINKVSYGNSNSTEGWTIYSHS